MKEIELTACLIFKVNLKPCCKS